MKKIIFLFILVANSLFGQEKYVNGVVGNSIDNAQFDIEEQYFQCTNITPPCPFSFSITGAKIYTKLWFEESIIKSFPKDEWKVEVTYEIEVHSTALGWSTTPITGQKLTINFDPTASYQDIDIGLFQPDLNWPGNPTIPHYYNAARLKVTNAVVTNLAGSTVSPAPPFSFGTNDIPSFIHFDLELEVDRVYDFDAEVTPRIKIGNYDVTKNELLLNWNYVHGADSYDFEYLVVDGDTKFLRRPINFDFKKATRISTKQNFYKISLAYPESIILFRTRAVGQKRLGPIPAPFKRIEGRWSTNKNGQTRQLSTPYLGTNIKKQIYTVIDKNYTNSSFEAYYWKGLEANKNWQYSAVFAEEGKKKEVIQFADGLLMEAQSATVINTDNTAMVNQPIRDWLGRTSLQVLPSPQKSQGIQWYDPLHFNTANQNYTYKDFDITTSSRDINQPKPLSNGNNKGAGNYYSDQNNQYLGINHHFIPDAEGYPFSRTIFYNDGTGRVKEQSGIGKQGFFDGGPRKDAMNHSTKFFYDKPDQEILLMLFGNNVGFDDFYERTIALDPNGQASVAYKDLAGRVIATSLMGDEPKNLLAIDTKPDTYPTITVDMSGPNSNQRIGDSLVINEKFTSAGGRYDFKYRLPATIFTNCISRDCIYDLNIKILDEYGNRVKLNYNGIQSEINLTASQNFNIDFFANLKFGSYQIIKSLRLNQIELDKAVSDYIAFNLDENNPSRCIEPKTVDPVDCRMDCESLCESTYYGPENNQGIRYITDDNGNIIGTRSGGVNSWYDNSNPANNLVEQAVIDCKTTCDNYDYTNLDNYPDECEIKYELLKLDMSPGGQYFDNLPDLGTTNYDLNKWLKNNLSYSSRDLQCIKTCLGFTQEIGEDDFWNYLRNNWQSDWGDILIQYHPEYCAFKLRCCSTGCSDADSGCRTAPFQFQTCDRGLTQIQKDSIDILINNRKADPQYNFRSQSDSILANLPDPALAPYFSAQALEQRTRDFYEEYYKYQTVKNTCNGLYIPGDDAYGVTYNGFQIRYPANPLFDDFDPSDPVKSSKAMKENNCKSQARLLTEKFMDDFNCKDLLTTTQLKQLEKDIYNEALRSCGENELASDLSDAIDQICCGYGLPKSCFASALPEPPPGACECDEVFQFVQDILLQNSSTANLPYDLYHVPSLALDPNVQNALDTYLDDRTSKSDFSDWFANCQALSNWYGNKNPITYPIDKSFECNRDELQADNTSTEDCGTELTDYYRALEQARFEQEVRDSAEVFRKQYIATCLSHAQMNEVFEKSYVFKEYHWTLYYYDQAGNLVETVPPAGIYQKDTGHNSLLTSSEITAAKKYLYGTSTQFVWPDHVMYSNYKYTSLNAIERQLMPDHGNPNDPQSQISKFYYDALGRLILSQNPYQKNNDEYSYLVYDTQGRSIESGAMRNPVNLNDRTIIDLDYLHGLGPSLYQNWFASGQKVEYVHTHYDAKPAASNLIYDQNQLRNRIAMIENFEDDQGVPKKNYATHYSYDELGNVTDLWQENFDLKTAIFSSPRLTIDHSIKHFKYAFDLISGNVNEIHYQKGFADYSAHRYLYDGDNRLTHSFTTTNGIIWNNDATYFYYAHGPLARVEYGQNKVFGDDRVYSIGGWLTAKNASTLDVNRDVGQDGLAGKLNENVGVDPFAFSLHYFENHFKPIESGRPDVLAKLDHRDQNETFDNLYNGNIPNMVVSLRNLKGKPIEVMGYSFKYDQLNRIREQRPLWDKGSNDPLTTNNFSNTDNQNGAFNTEYHFDGNGNLMTLMRNGINDYLNMDRFEYQYDISGGVRKNNRLNLLKETASANTYQNDIEKDHDYKYDALGRLVQDPAEDIDKIAWNVSNKVTGINKRVDPVADQNVDLLFHYDPLGNRVVKTVKAKDNLGNYKSDLEHKNSWYVLDAQGNPIAIYDYRKDASGVERLVLKELILYGSERLGTKNKNLKVFER